MPSFAGDIFTSFSNADDFKWFNSSLILFYTRYINTDEYHKLTLVAITCHDVLCEFQAGENIGVWFGGGTNKVNAQITSEFVIFSFHAMPCHSKCHKTN